MVIFKKKEKINSVQLKRMGKQCIVSHTIICKQFIYAPLLAFFSLFLNCFVLLFICTALLLGQVFYYSLRIG